MLLQSCVTRKLRSSPVSNSIVEQIRPLGDERQLAGCVYCGARSTTRNHVPSEILLSKPFPENLPVVLACNDCNQGFSGDEAYIADLIECARVGSADPVEITDKRVRELLERQPKLRSQFTDARVISDDGSVFFRPEGREVRNVVMKLARGHAAFELHDPRVKKDRRH
jgi:hypothetical protein